MPPPYDWSGRDLLVDVRRLKYMQASMALDLPGSAKVRPLGALVSRIELARGNADGAALVGIDGCGGAGKSALARLLAGAMPGSCIVEMDDFYRPRRDRPNWSHEIGGHFDWQRLEHQVLAPLSMGRDARFQRYEWDRDKLTGWREIPSRGVVLVDGVGCTRRELHAYYEFTIWIEASRDIRLARGLARDGEGARERWVNDWMPAEERYVAGHAPAGAADLIVIGDDCASVDPTRQFVEWARNSD